MHHYIGRTLKKNCGKNVNSIAVQAESQILSYFFEKKVVAYIPDITVPPVSYFYDKKGRKCD